MNRELRLLLAADAAMRLVGISCYTLFLAAVYAETGRPSDIGITSAATVVPALVVVACSGRYTQLLSPRGAIRMFMVARVVVFAAASVIGTGPTTILVAAALHSLLHQASLSAKMTLDAEILTDALRRRYNSTKTMLANLAVIIGPPLGGVAVRYLGFRASMLVVSGVSLAVVLLLSALRTGASDRGARTESSSSPLATLRYLRSTPAIASVIGGYLLVAVILEVEAPLMFPFVDEVYGRGSEVTGTLLGLAGVGGIAGAFLAQRFPALFTEAAIGWLIVFDGAVFLAFTQLTTVYLAAALFTLLGAMGAVTLVVVEGSVQQHVDAVHRPFAFSLMQFAGGAGGATVGIGAAFLAGVHGTRNVLAICAGTELLIGASLMVGWLSAASRRKVKVSADGGR